MHFLLRNDIFGRLGAEVPEQAVWREVERGSEVPECLTSNRQYSG